MRGVSKVLRRGAALLVLVTVFVAQGAVAAQRDNRNLADSFQRAKRFVVMMFGRFGLPPG